MTSPSSERDPGKPSKPTPDFPLFAHACGQWAKKVNGKLVYFGRWADPYAALAKYRDATAVQVRVSRFRVKDACNYFLSAKKQSRDSGEISDVSFKSYLATAKWVSRVLGPDTYVDRLSPGNFQALKQAFSVKRTIIGVGNEITRTKSIFKWCHNNGHIPTQVNFGTEFKKASARSLRRYRRQEGAKLFSAEQVLGLFDECGLHLQAMAHLGINCGFGPTDCGMLPLSAVDLDKAWISFPRPKTEVDREIPLWPETVAILRKSLARRNPKPAPGYEGLFFLTPHGKPWKSPQANYVSKQFRGVIFRSGLRRGGFYWLRHTFATVGLQAADRDAVKAIMGHVSSDVLAGYDETGPNANRLRNVTECVRKWLFA